MNRGGGDQDIYIAAINCPPSEGTGGVGEIEMDAPKRILRDRSDALAIEYCLIAAVILVAIIAGVHSLAGQ